MPNGSKVEFTKPTKTKDPNKRDTGSPESQAMQASIPVVPGQVIFFRDVNGVTGDTNTGRTYGLDGTFDAGGVKAQAAVNGINTTSAPLNAMAGIFLDDRRPDSWGLQPQLDFSDEGKLDFRTLSPKVKQVFFIGDGLTNDRDRLQEFVVPAGATRLFLGVIDDAGWWWDNTGEYRVNLFYGDTAQLVD